MGRTFWLPGTGSEIENHIPVLREGTVNLKMPRKGKGNLRLLIQGIMGRKKRYGYIQDFIEKDNMFIKL